MPHIAQLNIKKIRNVTNLPINLIAPPNHEFAHLILTGPNGSGKSGILEALAENIKRLGGLSAAQMQKQLEAQIENISRQVAQATTPQLLEHFTKQLGSLRSSLEALSLELKWGQATPNAAMDFKDGKSIFVFFNALRNVKVNSVQGPAKLPETAPHDPLPTVADSLLQTCVNKKTEQAYAQLDNDTIAVAAIDEWFKDLHGYLRKLFDDPGLRMEFERRQYDFRLIRGDGYQFDFQKLSHGYASTLQILAEILLRRELMRARFKDAQFEPSGVVIIDEIETHLHLRLQEIILPFITGLFPKVQFVVATHSPAVIASVPDALVVDLKSRQAVPSSEFIGKRYGTLMTSHFGVSSDLDVESTAELEEFRKLASNEQPSEDELAQRDRLATRLTSKSQALALEVWNILNLRNEARKA